MSGVRRIDDMEPAGTMIALNDRELFALYDGIVIALDGRRSPVLEQLREQIRAELCPALSPDAEDETAT